MKTDKIKIPAISIDSSDKFSLLIGNGIHRCFSKISTDQMLLDLKNEFNPALNDEEINSADIPFNMKVVIATHNNIKTAMKSFANKLTNETLNNEESLLIKDLLNLNFNCVMTTNYSFEIEKSILPNFTKGRRKNWTFYSKKVNPYYRYTELNNGTNKSILYHIHGDAFCSESMIIGHDYYCDQLNKVTKDLSSCYAARTIAYKKGIIEYKSWVDYLLNDNVVILGFGLDYCEIDIWKILASRKKHNLTNKIYYYYLYENEINNGLILLLKEYDIEVIIKKVENSDYLTAYKECIEEIKDIKDSLKTEFC